MTTHPLADPEIRESFLSSPDRILEDTELMRALAGAADALRGDNVIDMRAIAMDRLEARLDRLEDTHRTVIAAAYENLAGTNMIHRATLALMEPRTLTDFLATLSGPVAEILRVESLRLLLEAGPGAPRTDALDLADPGDVALHAGSGRDGTPRRVTLRQVAGGAAAIHGAAAASISSEACLRLDMGTGQSPGLLVMGSRDPQQFAPGQGTDLLDYFAGMVERALGRLL